MEDDDIDDKKEDDDSDDSDDSEGNQVKVMLFTSPTCPICPGAKEFIGKFSKKRTDFDLYKFSVADKEGQKYAQAFQVRSVPTFIIQGPGTKENIGLIGIQTEEVMNKYLDIAKGVKPHPDEKKGKFKDDDTPSEEKKERSFSIGKFKFKF